MLKVQFSRFQQECRPTSDCEKTSQSLQQKYKKNLDIKDFFRVFNHATYTRNLPQSTTNG